MPTPNEELDGSRSDSSNTESVTLTGPDPFRSGLLVVEAALASNLAVLAGIVRGEMTAKEQLRGRVDEMSEAQARQALVKLDGDDGRTSLDRLLDEAPIDDEPETPEERRAVEKAREEFRRGEGIPLAEVIRELG